MEYSFLIFLSSGSLGVLICTTLKQTTVLFTDKCVRLHCMLCN